MAKCPDCRGTGINPRRPMSQCPTCGGLGDMEAHITFLIKGIHHRNRSFVRRIIGRIFHV